MSEDEDPPRADIALQIRAAVEAYHVTILSGSVGLGQVATIRSAFDGDSSLELVFSDGRWLIDGYLAGFHNLIAEVLSLAEATVPELVTRHEQTLKRIWPTRPSVAFRVPRDLTNSSARDERTRFYHHEYQNKLLVGLTEFLLDVLRETKRSVLLVIKDAANLSPTSKSLIEVITRQKRHAKQLRFVLLDRGGAFVAPPAATISFVPYPREEFHAHLAMMQASVVHRESIYRMSRGNLRVGRALKHCFEQGISTVGHLDAEAIIDLYLCTIGSHERLHLALEYVRHGCSGDMIAERNADTIAPALLDTENATLHATALERYKNGEGPLVLAHAVAMSRKVQRLEALVEPCEILMGIGLYDTWFSIFAPMFADPDLRAHGDGDQPANGLFINAAFVLYATGNSRVSVPFLDEFVERFPRSRFIPTALYAQSMTYGRYQLPVDLDRAEAYATRNLALIDGSFQAHSKHKYIKVFAENAYAYIKARQGKFAEALALCERGNAEILSTYGGSSYQLHRSILIYNTSQVYEIVGDYEKAEARLREAIDCDPFYAEYQNDLGNLLSRIASRESEALQAYSRAIELSPPYYEAYLNRGVFYAQVGDRTSALADFERTLQIKPAEWRALREIGNVRLTSGDTRGALEAYSCALEYEDRDADLQANTGLACSELLDPEGAISCYLSAIALNPSHAAAHNNLAAELVNQGQYEEALKHVQLAMQHSDDPDFESNRTAIEALCVRPSRMGMAEFASAVSVEARSPESERSTVARARV